MLEDAAATAVLVLANDDDVDAGPMTIASATDPANGTVVLTGPVGARTGLTYQPDLNYCNDPHANPEDTFTYTLDGGSADPTGTVSMTVTCVNDAPVADDETFNGADSAVGNTSLVVNAPGDGPQTVTDPKKSISGDILAGDTDVDGPNALTVTAGTFATNDGGSVTVQADGDFTYVSDPADACADASDFFDYTVSDGHVPTAGTDVGRVTIAVSGCAWYVNNNDPGNAGTSAAPFNTLAQAESASAAGHAIFVFRGDGTTTGLDAGILMKASQQLIGEGASLVVGGTTLFTGGGGPARPRLTDNNADVVELAAGNTVAGMTIDPSGTGGGIAGGSGDAGGTISSLEIQDLGTAGTQPALELDGTSGTFDVSNFTVSTQAGTAVRLNSAGTVNFVAAGTVGLTANAGKALDATSTSFGTGSVIDNIGVTNSTVGGISLVTTTGVIALGDDIGQDLSLTTTEAPCRPSSSATRPASPSAPVAPTTCRPPVVRRSTSPGVATSPSTTRTPPTAPATASTWPASAAAVSAPRPGPSRA